MDDSVAMPAKRSKNWSYLHVYAVADAPSSAPQGFAIGLTGRAVADRLRLIRDARGVDIAFVHAILLPLASDSKIAKSVQASALGRVAALGGDRSGLAYPGGQPLATGFTGSRVWAIEACRAAYDEAAEEAWLPPLPTELGAGSDAELGLSPSDLAGWAGLGAAVQPDDAESLAMLLDEQDRRYGDAVPVERERMVRWIERGRVGELAKELCGRACQLCAKLGRSPEGFLMPDGRRYVESHHVEPVSMRKAGALHIRNIVVVCANHHRELHHGRVKPVHHEDRFEFDLHDGTVSVPRLKLKAAGQKLKAAL